MRHLVRNLTVWAVDVAASLALVVLDACSRPTVDQPPAEPTPPTVPDMPKQRPECRLFVISEAERFAIIRAKVAIEMGMEPAPEVLRLIDAMHERSARLVLEEYAEDFELWEAGK